jgi:hypothetical protein
MNREQRRAEKHRRPVTDIYVKIDKRKPMDLVGRISVFASAYQAIQTLRNRGEVQYFDASSLLGVALLAHRVAGKAGRDYSPNPVRSLIQAIERGEATEEQIDAAERNIRQADDMCKVTPRYMWAKSLREFRADLDSKELLARMEAIE